MLFLSDMMNDFYKILLDLNTYQIPYIGAEAYKIHLLFDLDDNNYRLNTLHEEGTE